MAIGDETIGFEYLIGNGGPDPVAALLATNLHTLALESGDSILSNDTDDETEYYFNGVSVNVAASAELNGFDVGVRYYIDREVENPDPDPDPDDPPTITRLYPNWTLVSTTFTVSVEGAPTDRPLYFTTTNPESLFTPDPGTYGGQAGALSAYATSGIIDGSRYMYTKVFNLSQFDFIPRLSPAQQGVVRPANGAFPNASDINDPANGIYPINTVTAFAPDPRRQVLVTYSLDFVYNLGDDNGNQTTGITIEQYVSQPVGDYGPTLKALLANSYYGHGIYGLDQWPIEEVPLYEADGDAIAPIPRIDVAVIDTSTSSGFAEYNQATYGADMPVVLDVEPEAVPEIPEDDIDTTDFGYEIDGLDYSSDVFTDKDIIDFAKYF